MIPSLTVDPLQVPFSVVKGINFPSSLFQHPTQFPSVTRFGAITSHGLFFAGSYSSGFLSKPAKEMRSPGTDPAGGARNSTTELSWVSAHKTIP